MREEPPLMLPNSAFCCRKVNVQVFGTSTSVVHILNISSRNYTVFPIYWACNCKLLLHCSSYRHLPLESSRGPSAERQTRVDAGEVSLRGSRSIFLIVASRAVGRDDATTGGIRQHSMTTGECYKRSKPCWNSARLKLPTVKITIWIIRKKIGFFFLISLMLMIFVISSRPPVVFETDQINKYI